MHTLEAHHDFKAPAQQLWELLEDFGNIQRWWPRGGAVDIQKVVLEGEGIGLIRHIYNEGMPAPVSEQLLYQDPANYLYRLAIVCQRPAGLLDYIATGRITALTPDTCRLEYHAEFEAEEGRADEARQFLLGAYELMFDGLAQTVARG